MAEIWQAGDYLGREVIFTTGQRDHVMQRHGDMANRLGEIRAAVEQPDFVTRDRRYQRREIPYRYTPTGQGFIRVVVNYRPASPQGAWVGAVITAFRVEERNFEEVQLPPHTVAVPHWPTEAVDPEHAWIDYEPLADEFLIYFSDGPVPAISNPLNGPGFCDVAVMFGLGPNRESTGEIVGVQVIPMLVGAVQDQPEWAVLAWAAMAGDFGDELLRDRLPAFLDAVHEAFDRYWTPAPPIEEQIAAIERARQQRDGETQGGRVGSAKSA